MIERIRRSALALLLAMIAVSTASAQEYPNRPIRMVVPFAAGGSSDTVARLLGQKLGVILGQPVLVENRPGAGGNIGMDSVAKAAPDGYTIVFSVPSAAINPSLYAKLPFDPVKDFAPVVHVCNVTGILVVHPAVSARSLQEFIALARAKPDALNYASAGSGTVVHLAGEMFKSLANVSLTHVPYKGSGPALTDLLGGQVQAMFANMPGTIQHVKAGKLRVLAVTSAKRSPLLPDLPAIGEVVPGYMASAWFGVFAPAATPAAIIAKLNDAFNTVLKDPEILAQLSAEGAEAVGGTPEAFGRFFRDDIARWAPIVKTSGAKAN